MHPIPDHKFGNWGLSAPRALSRKVELTYPGSRAKVPRVLRVMNGPMKSRLRRPLLATKRWRTVGIFALAARRPAAGRWNRSSPNRPTRGYGCRNRVTGPGVAIPDLDEAAPMSRPDQRRPFPPTPWRRARPERERSLLGRLPHNCTEPSIWHAQGALARSIYVSHSVCRLAG